MVELNTEDLNKAATTKSHLVLGAHILTKTAAHNYKFAITTLNSLHKRSARSIAIDNGGLVGTQETTTTSCLTSTISITPTTARAMVTPRPILQGNKIVRALLVIHKETALAL